MYVNEFFSLNTEACLKLHSLKPNFGYNGYGELVFYRTYSRIKKDGSQENWADVVIRVINGTMSIRKDWYVRNYIHWDEPAWQKYARKMALSMFHMYWMPPGRGLWAMGTPFVFERGSMALFNCFSGDTKFVANQGIHELKSMVGKKIGVKTTDGQKSATVKSFGEQSLYNIVLKPRIGHSKYRLIYQATRNHRWLLADGKSTTGLVPGDVIKITPNNVTEDSSDYEEGFVHGLIFADGYNHYKSKYTLRLFGWKLKYREMLMSSKYYSHTVPSNDRLIFESDGIAFKAFPENDQNIYYKQGFFDAWRLFDGHWKKGSYCIDSTHKDAVQWLSDHSGLLNYVMIGHSVDNAPTNYGERNNPLHRILVKFEPVEFIVDTINYAHKTEEVYCVVEEETHSFMLAGGVITGNCGATKLGNNETFSNDVHWLMDALMLGVGVGFEPVRDDLYLFDPSVVGSYKYEIADSREGWIDSVKLLIDAFTKPQTRKPIFIYDKIRPEGLPIRGFGGKASGPAPLKKLHEQIEGLLEQKYIDRVRLKADIGNLVATCVVSGNVRRSAQLMKGSVHDQTFMDLKDYDKNPEREAWGGMSNNSVALLADTDFEQLGEVAIRVVVRGEPGIMNLRNFKYGRIGKPIPVREDLADLINPCIRGSTKLLTPQGIRNLSALKVGNFIWSKSGWTKIVNKWSTGINEVFQFKTTAGSFYGTENHKIIWQGIKIEVKEAQGIDIIEGPYLSDIICDGQAIIDGLVIGDGTDYHGTIVLNIGIDDQDYFQSEIKSFIDKQRDKEYYYEVKTTIDNLPVTYLRTVPEKYLYGNNYKVCGFLRGLFSANGSICGNRITLKAVSFELIEQVQMMLSSVGIRSYFTTNKESLVTHHNGDYVSKQSYDLNINKDRDKFKRIIGFIQKYKMEKLIDLIKSVTRFSQKDTYDIVEKIYLGKEETFDITVDNHTHTYWTQCCDVSNCGEILLEDKELCNVDETCPTQCSGVNTWYEAIDYATFYASTVALLPTHRQETNKIMARNRRIGVGIIDWSGWVQREGLHKVTAYMRKGYEKVTEFNKKYNSEAGVPESIRKTTIKPGGSIPKLLGKTPGIGYPTFIETIRRTRIAANHPMCAVLNEAEIPCEPEYFDPKGTLVYEYPIKQGPTLPAECISIWEQAVNLATVQREWADNSVSNTIYFKPKWLLTVHEYSKSAFKDKLDALGFFMDQFTIGTIEVDDYKTIIKNGEYKFYTFDPNHEEDQIEKVCAAFAPLIKSMSFLPHTTKGVYRQMPEEGISEEEYNQRLADIKQIDWSTFRGSDGEDEKYCVGDACEIKL